MVRRAKLHGVMAAAAILAAGVSCTSSVDPNQGRFSCQEQPDCGDGFECRPQASGGGLCFKVGECQDSEVCNGLDDDCNGLVDEAFPEQDRSCATGRPGVCGPGRQTCTDGQLTCASLVQPSAEVCDGKDNDCDGAVDDGFNFATDNLHCGRCTTVCAAGSSCVSSICRETNCSDGVDNNQNGLVDCQDPACASRGCDPADALLNCGRGYPLADAGIDGGDFDAGPSDGGDSDGGFTDAGDPDGGLADAGEADAGPADAGDLDGGLADAGSPDGGLPDAGAPDGGPPRSCVPRETDCQNGADDDLDGLTDCADDDCDGKLCRVGTLCANRVCPPPG